MIPYFCRHYTDIMAELPKPTLTFDLVETGCHGNFEVVPVGEWTQGKVQLPAKTVTVYMNIL